jgi:hypothetical protein
VDTNGSTCASAGLDGTGCGKRFVARTTFSDQFSKQIKERQKKQERKKTCLARFWWHCTALSIWPSERKWLIIYFDQKQEENKRPIRRAACDQTCGCQTHGC